MFGRQNVLVGTICSLARTVRCKINYILLTLWHQWCQWKSLNRSKFIWVIWIINGKLVLHYRFAVVKISKSAKSSWEWGYWKQIITHGFLMAGTWWKQWQKLAMYNLVKYLVSHIFSLYLLKTEASLTYDVIITVAFFPSYWLKMKAHVWSWLSFHNKLWYRHIRFLSFQKPKLFQIVVENLSRCFSWFKL